MSGPHKPYLIGQRVVSLSTGQKGVVVSVYFGRRQRADEYMVRVDGVTAHGGLTLWPADDVLAIEKIEGARS